MGIIHKHCDDILTLWLQRQATVKSFYHIITRCRALLQDEFYVSVPICNFQWQFLVIFFCNFINQRLRVEIVLTHYFANVFNGTCETEFSLSRSLHADADSLNPPVHFKTVFCIQVEFVFAIIDDKSMARLTTLPHIFYRYLDDVVCSDHICGA